MSDSQFDTSVDPDVDVDSDPGPDPADADADANRIDIESLGDASEAQSFEITLDGVPLDATARPVSEGDLEDVIDEVESNRRDMSEAELDRHVKAKLIRDHYDELRGPNGESVSMDFLTANKLKEKTIGYSDTFLDPIAPQLTELAGNR